MKILTRNIPNIPDDSYHIYDITTNHGLVVSILDLGASIQKIAMTLPKGDLFPLALGSSDINFYKDHICYAGATLAPAAGRIRHGDLPVCDQNFQLSSNDGEHHLHGGFHNLSNQVWNTDSVDCTNDTAIIVLSCSQPDGLDGYPGNRRYQVRYCLEDTNWLTIEYTAWTDAPTYINMSNHTYWNLSGDFTTPALNQELTLFSNNVCINDSAHLPADIIPVSHTAFDFRLPRTPASAMESTVDFISQKQLQIARGYNHAFLLNKNQPFRTLRNVKRPKTLKKAAVLQDPVSGHTVRMMTDAPALVFYSGGFLPEGMPLHNLQASCPSCAIALEAQDLPDVMHLLPDSYTLTTPEQPFHRVIRFHIL